MRCARSDLLLRGRALLLVCTTSARCLHGSRGGLSGGRDSHPTITSAAAPPVPPPSPPPVPSLAFHRLQSEEAAENWEDIMFFAQGASDAGPVDYPAVKGIAAEGLNEDDGFLSTDASMGIAEAMDQCDAAVRDGVGIRQGSATTAGSEEGDASHDRWTAQYCSRGAAVEAETYRDRFETEAELEAFFSEHYGVHLADSGFAQRPSDAAAEESAADGQAERRAAVMQRRSSLALLETQSDFAAGDLVGNEEARDAQQLVAALQLYAPTEEQLATWGELDDGEENGVDSSPQELGFDEEADTQAKELGEHFWWQRKPRDVLIDSIGAEVLPPLRIPDKSGNVAESAPSTGPTVAIDTAVGEAATRESQLVLPPLTTERWASRQNSFLARQDRLYLAPQTPPEAQAPSAAGTTSPGLVEQPRRQCVLVAFAANDLRVHDNYALALASVRAHTAGGLPVVAVCVLDYRTFAQPSIVGGFFRQSPLRASFLLETVAALRAKLETEYKVPLLVRVGRPEEHIPRLAVELGALDVFLTTQYAPHERRVHDAIMRAVRRGAWVSRRELRGDELVDVSGDGPFAAKSNAASDPDDDDEGRLVCVEEHDPGQGDFTHPYGGAFTSARQACFTNTSAAPPHSVVPHSVWQTTLVHLDDLPTPVAAMKEGERWYHDDVTVATIRPTKPYDRQIQKLTSLPCWSELLPSPAEARGLEGPSVVRGALPTLYDLGYAQDGNRTDLARLLSTEEVIATQSSHPTAGEDAAITHVQDWLQSGGLTSMLRYGKPRRTNTKMYSQKLSRVSPYISAGALSPRKFYELLRGFAHEQLRDGFVQMQYREALLRLSRRDYWHWMGLRFGDRLFYSYGPHPDGTDRLPDWRHDPKVVQRWCLALTGIPFADAAMRELLTTGYVAQEGRQALVWLLVRGYGQDWRLGAEWLERCSLDYDPFCCYGNAAYYGELIQDDFGETVRNVHFLAHRHDQTGIYVKKWLPQLSKVPPVYIHRPHVMTPRMQAMHGVFLGRNYPFPLKLWDGAQHTFLPTQLPSYFAGDGLTRASPPSVPISADAASPLDNYADKNHKFGAALGPGYAEAVRCGVGVMEPEELNTAVHAGYITRRQWAQAFLPDTTLAAIAEGNSEDEELMTRVVAARRQQHERGGKPTVGRATL